MNQELTKVELLRLAIVDFASKNARLVAIQAEMDRRLEDISEIGAKIDSKSIHSLAEADSLLEDLHNHTARVAELRAEVDLMVADYAMDMHAIAHAPR